MSRSNPAPSLRPLPRLATLALLCASLAPLPALAADAAPTGLSYSNALALAAERAPMLAARRAAVEGAEQQRISAAELPDPKLIAGVDNLPLGGPERFTIGKDGMTQRSVGWMQDMPNRDKRAARAAVADARAERERAMLTADTLTLQREVAQAWLMRWFAEKKLALFKALEDENKLLLDTMASRLAGGRAMPGDSTMARQDALMLADRRDELARERTQAQATLVRWLGDAAAQPLAGEPPALRADASAIHAGIERHADLRAYEPMLRMAEADMREADSMRKGDWGWQIMYSRRGRDFGDMLSFQFTFELPLFSKQRQDPQVAAKRKDIERIAAEREDQVRRRREEMDMQLAELDETEAKLKRLNEASTPLAQERVALALAAYEAGRGELAAVLAARRERAELGLRALELQARRVALQAKLNYLIAE